MIGDEMMRPALADAANTRLASLLAAGVLGHSLRALGHGVLGQLTGQKQADGRLDLPGRDGALLVVVCFPHKLFCHFPEYYLTLDRHFQKSSNPSCRPGAFG